MKKKSILNSPHIEELKRRKRRILRIKILFFFFCFLILLTGLVFLSRWKKINIESINITGNKIIETETIESIAKEDLAGHYLWVFPKTNLLLYSQKHLRNELQDKIKRLSSVSTNIDDVNTLEISVTERDGRYTWCGESTPTETEEGVVPNCYFLDSIGYIFDEAPYFSGNVYFKFYGPITKSDDKDSDGPLGSYFQKENFEKIISFKKTLEEFGFNPHAFWIDENGDGNISLSSAETSSPKIIFKINSDYQKISENLQAALATEPLQSKIKKELSSLLYIDLKFGNKVYYRFNE